MHPSINPAANIILTAQPTKDRNEPGRRRDKPVQALDSLTHSKRMPHRRRLPKKQMTGVRWSGLSAHRTCMFCVILFLELFRAFVPQKRVLPYSIVVRLNVLENLRSGIVYTHKDATLQ